MLRREIPGHLEPGAGKLCLTPQPDIGLGQDVQALFRCDPGKVSDRELIAEGPKSGIVALEADAKWHNVHLVAGDSEVTRHELCVVFADRHEGVHVLEVGPNQLQ